MPTATVRARALAASGDHSRFLQIRQTVLDFIAANPQLNASLVYGAPVTLPNGDVIWGIVLTSDIIPQAVLTRVDQFNEQWDPGGV